MNYYKMKYRVIIEDSKFGEALLWVQNHVEKVNVEYSTDPIYEDGFEYGLNTKTQFLFSNEFFAKRFSSIFSDGKVKEI